MRVLKSVLALAALMVPSIAVAQQPNAALQALDDALPGTLINDPTRLDWDVSGATAKSKPIKSADIPGGGAALQVTSPALGKTRYEIVTNAPITAAIKTGEQIVVAFYARTVSAATPDGKGVIAVRIQQNSAPYPGFGETVLKIGTDWQLFEVSATADRNIQKGLAVASFQLSGAKQVVEIGQTIIVSGATSIAKKAGMTQSATTDVLPQLKGKGKLISNPSDKAWVVYGAGETHKNVPSPNIPGTGGTALQITTKAPAKAPYDIGVSVPITDSIAQGDVLLIGILARTAPSGTADGTSKLGVRVQRNEAPYPGFGDNVLTLGPTWRLLQLKTQAKIDIPFGKAVLGLHVGAAAQSIEIGQVYVINTSVLVPTGTQ
jgi:hypothetical protein